jgi:hypothetical protein
VSSDDFHLPSGYTDLDPRYEGHSDDEDLLSEESMTTTLPQVPQSHRYSTLSNIRWSSPSVSRRVLTGVEGLMARLARGGQRAQRGRDADVEIDLTRE